MDIRALFHLEGDVAGGEEEKASHLVLIGYLLRLSICNCLNSDSVRIGNIKLWWSEWPTRAIFCSSCFSEHAKGVVKRKGCPIIVSNQVNLCFLCIFFRTLDLSFNLIKTIENLGCLTKVKKLFLVSNKISKIEGLQNLSQLEMTELGANKIRVSTK